MSPRCVLVPVLMATVLFAGRAAAMDKWAHLRPGMSAEDAMATLGKPLIRNVGKGYERWVYDNQGEVVFFDGPIMAWTHPAKNPVSAAKPIETDLPLQPRGVIPVARPAAQPQVVPDADALPVSGFIYRRS